MTAVEVKNLSYAYGREDALRGVELTVPEGALYALVGPNGSGKTTLLQIIEGLRRPRRGSVALFGVDSRAITLDDRRAISYVAEGRSLPGWMRLEEAEAYLAPLYPTWDASLASDLRQRFELEPRRRIGTLSRGERMKASLLCALAPRPRLLLMDEPFTGMDVVVKDDLVRGLLAASGNEGWTVVISSHDIAELEVLADWVGFLEHGHMRLSEPMERLRGRFKRVSVVADEASAIEPLPGDEWLVPERAGRRLTFIAADASDSEPAYSATLRARFPRADHIEVQDASLREVFIALARGARTGNEESVA